MRYLIMSKLSSSDVKDEISELRKKIVAFKPLLDEVTYDSFFKVIDYYEGLLAMDSEERMTSVYGLTSTYALLLLSSTYDVAIKDIFRNQFSIILADKQNIQKYLSKIIDTKILNRYMTNIKHDSVKKTFAVATDTSDPKLQRCIGVINELIETRNKIAHGLEPSSKGHDDLRDGLESVIYYLKWYISAIENNFNNFE